MKLILLNLSFAKSNRPKACFLLPIIQWIERQTSDFYLHPRHGQNKKCYCGLGYAVRGRKGFSGLKASLRILILSSLRPVYKQSQLFP